MCQCYVICLSWNIFGENDLLTPVTPNDPGWIFNVITFVEGVKLMHMHKSCVNATYSVWVETFLDFEKYDTLWPLTPLGGVVWQGHHWLFWSFDYCLQDDIVSFYFVAIFIFFMWMTFFSFWPQWPHRDLEPHHCLCLSSGQGTGHCDQVWLKSDVGKYAKKTCCQKKKKKKKETRKKQKPAA